MNSRRCDGSVVRHPKCIWIHVNKNGRPRCRKRTRTPWRLGPENQYQKQRLFLAEETRQAYKGQTPFWEIIGSREILDANLVSASLSPLLQAVKFNSGVLDPSFSRSYIWRQSYQYYSRRRQWSEITTLCNGSSITSRWCVKFYRLGRQWASAHKMDVLASRFVFLSFVNS